MTSDEQAFLDAICANVADDAPRLVYADWLDQNGQSERAEFVRIQCELATLPQQGQPRIIAGKPVYNFKDWNFCPRRDELQERERGLLAFHGNTWLAREVLDPCQFYDVLDVTNLAWLDKEEIRGLYHDVHPVWRRGFVAEITLPCAAWLEHRDALLKTTPLEQVTLTQIPWRRTHDTYTIRRGQLFFIGWEDGREVDLSFPPLSEEQRSLQRTQAEFVRNSILYGNPFASRPQGVIHARR